MNLSKTVWDQDEYPKHRIMTLAGDACQLPDEDNSYDIVFSNSVIEHVGDWKKQQAFACEVRRVGKALWVQTPAYECPIEPHYIAPFVHYLPKWLQKASLRWITPWGWMQKPTQQQIDESVDSNRLLTKREMKELFPDCRILTERLLGIIPKSYIAVRDRVKPAQAA